CGKESSNAEQAKLQVERMTREPAVGEKYAGTVTKTTTFGAFVEITPGRDGLIHISKLSKGRVERVEDVVNVGDKVDVEIEAIDDLGRINLRLIDSEASDHKT
ncbi:MAG: S1 RNA-binding domain-containing protein, partial [Actinomycetota bacterium]|nr:S1 RNA-binding domain-containing protein [Actinomycetota bacterium]